MLIRSFPQNETGVLSLMQDKHQVHGPSVFVQRAGEIVCATPGSIGSYTVCTTVRSDTEGILEAIWKHRPRTMQPIAPSSYHSRPEIIGSRGAAPLRRSKCQPRGSPDDNQRQGPEVDARGNQR